MEINRSWLLSSCIALHSALALSNNGYASTKRSSVRLAQDSDRPVFSIGIEPTAVLNKSFLGTTGISLNEQTLLELVGTYGENSDDWIQSNFAGGGIGIKYFLSGVLEDSAMFSARYMHSRGQISVTSKKDKTIIEKSDQQADSLSTNVGYQWVWASVFYIGLEGGIAYINEQESNDKYRKLIKENSKVDGGEVYLNDNKVRPHLSFSVGLYL
ncbi:hypothetical protein [Oligoflexus tunisiensis]|uniref:hypothetical protein n=1 Tax=Oligoflexus tunisiensis TaxID=708132 RepID=UPI00114CFC39|nr:hypothetical protein [Oligoflexus tunisiensis]